MAAVYKGPELPPPQRDLGILDEGFQSQLELGNGRP